VPVNLPYEGKSTKYQWLDALRDGDHGMTPTEGYLLSELVRSSSERWQDDAYQRTALANHDLAHRGVFAAWPSTDTLAHRIGVKRRQLQKLSDRLQARGYLTVLTNAGGTGKWEQGRRPNLWVIDARTVPVIPRGALQDTPQCTVVREGVHSSTQRGALQDTQIVSEESVNTNSLNVAVNGQREMASVKADELPEQMTLALLEAVRDTCPHHEQAEQLSAARALDKMGAKPDEVRQFTQWWINTGRTFAVTPNVIKKHWTAFAAAHSTDRHQPTASSGSIWANPEAQARGKAAALAGFEEAMEAARKYGRNQRDLWTPSDAAVHHAAREVKWMRLCECTDYQRKALREEFVERYLAFTSGISFADDEAGLGGHAYVRAETTRQGIPTP